MYMNVNIKNIDIDIDLHVFVFICIYVCVYMYMRVCIHRYVQYVHKITNYSKCTTVINPPI